MSDLGRAVPAALPPGYEPYRSTPVFSELTVPPALLRSHRTAPGTWALIRVLEGQLLYRVLDPPSERVLESSGLPGLVEPGIPHEVGEHQHLWGGLNERPAVVRSRNVLRPTPMQTPQTS